MHKLIYTFLCGATLALSLPAGAHTEDYFDSKEAADGGQTRMTGAISSGACGQEQRDSALRNGPCRP